MQSIPLFWPNSFPYAAWYLDAVAPSQWSWVESRAKDDTILGILPYRCFRWYGLPRIAPPPLAPRLGPVLFIPEHLNSFRQQQDFHWRVLTDLVEQLPPRVHARIQWAYGMHNGLPWQQQGWRQSVRYSYVLDLRRSPKEIWSGFKSSLRNKIRKAERQLLVRASTDWRTTLQLTKANFRHRGAKLQLSESLLERLDTAAVNHEARQIWEAVDSHGRVHASIWLLHDNAAAYNLLLGSDPQLRQSGAAPLLLWHAIQWSHRQDLITFDFEGSQLPGVEPFFRSFGGIPKAYYQFERFG